MQLNLINPFVVFLKLLNKHDRYKLSWRMNDGAALYTNVKLKNWKHETLGISRR